MREYVTAATWRTFRRKGSPTLKVLTGILQASRKAHGKFDIVDITVFVDDWNDTDDDRDCLEYYKKSETYMGCAKIG